MWDEGPSAFLNRKHLPATAGTARSVGGPTGTVSPRIVVENSAWANIGNAFFQMALWWLLRDLFPEAEVTMGNGLVARTFAPGRFFSGNVFEVMEWQKADLHVFSGPILGQLDRKYGGVIRSIFQRGERYALLSCSGAGASSDDVARVTEFLRRYPPAALYTRDPETFERFSGAVATSYNGICAGFLVRHLPITTVDLGRPYFISSFYTGPEPAYELRSGGTGIDALDIVPRRSLRRHLWRYAKVVDWTRRYPRELGNYLIVRPVHSIKYALPLLNYPAPNCFLSHNPLSYLALYKAAEFTVSDRVHACVASLALGRPAQLFLSDPRSGVFDRLDLNPRSPMRLDVNRLVLEENCLRDFLRESIGRVLRTVVRERR